MSPEASPAETVELTPAQVVPDRGLPGRGVDDAVGEVERAGVGRPELQAAAVELRDRAHAAEHGAEDQPHLALVAPLAAVQPLASRACSAATSSRREVRSTGRRLRSPR